MSKEIGRKLKQLRKEKGFTQQIAAEKLGITRSTISNYEIGRRSPHLTDLQKIAELYGAGLEMFGVVQTDEALDLLIRAREVFESPNVSKETKENLYTEFMKLYLELRGAEK